MTKKQIRSVCYYDSNSSYIWHMLADDGCGEWLTVICTTIVICTALGVSGQSDLAVQRERHFLRGYGSGTETKGM